MAQENRGSWRPGPRAAALRPAVSVHTRLEQAHPRTLSALLRLTEVTAGPGDRSSVPHAGLAAGGILGISMPAGS